jgi:pSer/pThr/pTyr-binding forkhead associated (FHA) protein
MAPDAMPARPIALTQELTLIGRELDNDIVLDDDRVSRRHAELRWDHGRAELADYGSLNGTLINQQAARGRLLLRDGDIIEFGKHRYRFELQADAGSAGAASPAGAAQEPVETRKTASISGSFALGHPLLRLALIQGEANGAEGQGAVWPLRGAVITIGRDPTCDVSLSDTAISRTHAQITRQPAGYFIADLQSSNGVYLNGERLTAPAQIFAGDIIALGDCLLRCEENSREATSAPPAGVTPPVAELDAQASAAPTIALSPTGAPAFHMRIAPEWASPHVSRPRLAPPRLTPTPRQDDAPAS